MSPTIDLRRPLVNILVREGITTVEILSLCSEIELRQMHMVSVASIRYIKDELAEHELSLRTSEQLMLAKASEMYQSASDMPLYVLTAPSDIGKNTKRMLHVELGSINLSELVIIGKASLTAVLIRWKHLDDAQYPVQRQLQIIEAFLSGVNLYLDK
ncbi:hypothetical protein H7200_00070 [Candidatus Saccharibacteria bacterium]|nr:hypothetical protein [Candidatus Saccharibacteria bacterium]